MPDVNAWARPKEPSLETIENKDLAANNKRDCPLATVPFLNNCSVREQWLARTLLLADRGAAELSACCFEAVPYSEYPDSLVFPWTVGASTRKTPGKSHYEKRLSRKFPQIPAPFPASR